MAQLTEARKEKLESRLAWLEASLAKLRDDYDKAPRMLLVAFAAIPVWFVFNWMAAALVIFTAVMLTGVQYYVAWIHINENETELRFIQEELGTVARDKSI